MSECVFGTKHCVESKPLFIAGKRCEGTRGGGGGVVCEGAKCGYGTSAAGGRGFGCDAALTHVEREQDAGGDHVAKIRERHTHCNDRHGDARDGGAPHERLSLVSAGKDTGEKTILGHGKEELRLREEGDKDHDRQGDQLPCLGDRDRPRVSGERGGGGGGELSG